MIFAHHRNNYGHDGSPWGRNHMQTDYILINNRVCLGCSQCVNECPRGVIGQVKWFRHQHAHIDRADDCIGCKKCVNACPTGAIIDLKPKEASTGRKSKADSEENPGLEQCLKSMLDAPHSKKRAARLVGLIWLAGEMEDSYCNR